MVSCRKDPSFLLLKRSFLVCMQDEPTLWRLKFLVKDALENTMKKKKEETTKAGDLRGTQSNEVSNKRNATNKLAERRTKRSRP